MLTLGQARRKNAHSGEPIYCPIEGLNRAGAYIRRGQLTIVAAGPGGGKTALVHSILHAGDGKGNVNPTLFFSADSGPDVLWKRSAALSMGYAQADIDQMLHRGETEAIEAKIRTSEAHIMWDFTGSPSAEHIVNEIDAYAERMGAYPTVIVMDNLKDCYVGGFEDEFRALEEACVWLKDLARDTGAAVIALHHVGGIFEDGLQPVPMSGLRGKVSKTPATILTIHRNGEYMNISPVKNRTGKADATGRWYMPVRADLSTMRFAG